MSEVKTSRTGEDVAAFLARTEPTTRREDSWQLKTLIDTVTGAPAHMWGPSMVGYGLIHYRYSSGHSGEMMVLGFAPRKAHMVLYGLNIAANETLLSQLRPHRSGVSCIYLNRLSAVDVTILEEMIVQAWKQESSVHPQGHVFTRLE